MVRGGDPASRLAQEKLIRSSVLGEERKATKVTKSSSIKSLRQRLKQSKSSNHHRRGGRKNLSISSSSSVSLSRAPCFREINEKSSIAQPLTDALTTKTDNNKRTKQPTKIPVYQKVPATNLCCGSVTPNYDAHRCSTYAKMDDQQLDKKIDNAVS